MEQTENQAGKERMQMWRAGIFKSTRSKELGVRSKNLNSLPLAPCSLLEKGFTLIELLVTLSILSITLSFVIPRIMGREEAELKSAARKLLYTVRRFSDEAVFKKERRVLNVDIDNNEYRKGDDGKRTQLPSGISIDHLQIGKEEIKKGTASITIFPSGFRDEAMIHLTGKEKGKGYTVVIPALGERFEIRED
ncbi:MAG: type II secretion system protein [Deltaproteobacteria bacterium]